MQRSRKITNYLLSILIGMFLLFLFAPSMLVAQDEFSEEDYLAELEAYEAKLQAEADMLVSFGYAPELGPGEFELSNRATLFVPEGYVFLGEQGTMMTMQFMENVITGTEVGMLMSADENESWYAVFSFEKIGYVSDVDYDDFDPDELLEWTKNSVYDHNMERKE